MAAITIRKLDKSVVDALKRRAAAAGRSMEEEARQALIDATQAGKPSKDEVFARMRALSAKVGRIGGPSAVEIIRQQRDERTKRLSGE